MWHAFKTVLKGKFIKLNVYVRRQEMFPINNLRSYMKKEGEKKHNKINPKQAKGRK